MNRTQKKGETEDARDQEEYLKGKILKEITADLSWEEETLLQLTKAFSLRKASKNLNTT